MKIAISGTSGLIGRALKKYFQQAGHEVTEITRHRTIFNKHKIVYWNLKKHFIDIDALQRHDVIINLAGANISAKRWSREYKQEIVETRVISTKLLVDAMKEMNPRPKVFFCASAVGYYGNRDPNVPVNEHGGNGHGFLAQVCQQWENASADAILYGVRLIHMRFGVVLSSHGGALAKMLPVFFLGLGGRLGNGRQKMSWIALDEISSIINQLIWDDRVSGAVNFVTPNPVTNKEFTKTLGKVLFRPTILPVPGFIIKLLMGQMGKELLLDGAHVVPQALLDIGYEFQHPQLEPALRKIL